VVQRNKAGFSWLIILLVLVVLAAIGGVGYKVFKKEPAKSTASSTPTASSSSSSSAKTESTAATSTAPTAAQLESIKASITSENTAALEGYMASSVNVIIAASEAYGPQTPVQAVKDVDYVKDGDTWDFALPAATLAAYRAGDYKAYFPTTALVGKSSNGYVISFQFDSAGKINGIFMTNHDSIL
jgi:cytoskeletal protein RodZ